MVALTGLAGLMLFLFGMVRAGIERWSRSLPFLAVAGLGLILIIVAIGRADREVWMHTAGILALLVIYAFSARTALGKSRHAGGSAQTTESFSVKRGVLILNPKSGGGKAEQFELAKRAREMGVEPVVLRPGDDLEQLARDAAERGADAIGMGGGDGSQALVASVCIEHDLPFVCVPAGTRNHLAMDLGLNRDDPSLALAAFASGEERRIDYGLVNGRLFVNNVSLGVYARIVQEPGYRDAKIATAIDLLPDIFGDDAERFDLRFEDPDGVSHEFAHMLLVSNNAYVLTPGDGLGYRTRMDAGELGVVMLAVENAPSISEMIELIIADPTKRSTSTKGFRQWCAPSFTVASDSKVLAGVDGEAIELDPPVRFETRPAGLRVLLPPGTPDEVAPPKVALNSDVFRRLWNVAHDRGADDDGSA